MNDSQKGHRLEAAAESTAAKLLARFVTPVLIAIVGFFLVGTMKDIKDTQQRQGQDITQMRTELAIVNTRMDERVLRQVDANSKQIENHEERLRILERTTGTP